MKKINRLIAICFLLSTALVLVLSAPGVVNAQYECTYHAYRLCMGNNIYWYDSCGTLQDLSSICNGGQICQYGQCIFNVQTYSQPQNNYMAHSRTACNGNSVSWYDSLGIASGLYQNCTDNNSCTLDTCFGNKCSNTLKCDGTTCAVGSADHNTYCAATQPAVQTHCGNNLCEPILGETTANCPNDCKIATNAVGLSITFFTKNDPKSDQWQKAAQVNSNSQIYFMISVVNSSIAQIDNINISASVPAEVSSLGNLQLNGIPVSGDITSGINIGSLAPKAIKLVNFEGKTQLIPALATKQAIASSNVSGAIQSDSITINLTPSQAAAAVSNITASTGFMGFLKRWYLWILGSLALIFLFVVVFKRLSSDV